MSLEARNDDSSALPTYPRPAHLTISRNSTEFSQGYSGYVPVQGRIFSSQKKKAQRGVGPALLAVLLCLHKSTPKETKCKTNTLFGIPFDEAANDGKKLWDRFILADETIHFPFYARHRP
jgi:hypothetical protein